MKPIKCRRCGAPLPIGVGRENFACVYCGAVDSIDPHLKNRVLEYYELVRRLGPGAKKIPLKLRELIETFL